MNPRCRLLGPVSWTNNCGRVGSPGGVMVNGLLARLALSANRVVPLEVLLADLWPDDAVGLSESTIRVHVSRLRAALGEDRKLIETRSPGYILLLAEDEVDANRCARLVREGEAALANARPVEAALAFRHATTLFTGPVLDGLDQPFVPAPRARLEALRLTAIEGRVQADLECGRHRELIAELEALTTEHPTRERLWQARMLALVRSDRSADAVEAYRTLRGVLADELGIDPAPELQQLEATIRRDPRSLAAPDHVQEATPSADGRRPFVVLLTDIENSTLMWEQSPDGMALALRRHDELVDRAVDAQGGTVLKHRGEGDSTFSVFPDVASAVQAAVVLQLWLAEQEWPSACQIRVRAGIHSGIAERQHGDLYGPELNGSDQSVVARVGHADVLAVGTSTTVTAATRDLHWFPAD